MYRYRSIYGVDFSGAKDAGKKIWIAEGVIEESRLHIEKCESAVTFLETSNDRDKCLSALSKFLASKGEAAIGLDFPFSLPREIVQKLFGVNNWEGLIQLFAERYSKHSEPERFREDCRASDGGHEVKRETDREVRAPWAAYNLKLYRQTYFGMREILAQLVRDKAVCVLPMQDALPGKPWLLEICPAATLKNLGLYGSPYKGKGEEQCKSRKHILQEIEKLGPLCIPDANVRERVLQDQNGDALDSVLAALATFRTISDPMALAAAKNEKYVLEGYIYVGIEETSS